MKQQVISFPQRCIKYSVWGWNSVRCYFLETTTGIGVFGDSESDLPSSY